MAVNNNFYVTLNEMVNRASGGSAKAIVDYATFVEAGKAITESMDFANAFAAEIANKVKLSIDVVRSYQGKLGSLTRGQVSPNAVIEMITNLFYDTRAAQFVKLTDDQTVDMWKISKGKQNVQYWINDVAFSLNVTIQSVELAGAFQSPEAMDAFLQGKITYLLNSLELGKEQARRGLLGALIKELDAASAATSPDGAAQKYELVTMFNTMYGLVGDDALTSDNALYNGEFVKFAISEINKVSKKLSNPSINFNTSGVKTFTPDTASDKKLITIGALDSAIAAFKTTFSPDATMLGDHESVEFWQAEAAPYVVSSGSYVTVATTSGRTDTTKIYYVEADGKFYKYSGGAWVEITSGFDGEETASSPVCAVLFDKYAIGEYVCHQAVHTTPYNVVGEYWNEVINYQGKYVRNKDANAVLFTLD